MRPGADEPRCRNIGVNMQEFLMKIYVAVSVVFLLMVLPACGDLYSWTDANGVKHFIIGNKRIFSLIWEFDEAHGYLHTDYEWEFHRE
jgi:hypothetical protein